jgi:hypothetical protein
VGARTVRAQAVRLPPRAKARNAKRYHWRDCEGAAALL